MGKVPNLTPLEIPDSKTDDITEGPGSVNCSSIDWGREGGRLDEVDVGAVRMVSRSSRKTYTFSVSESRRRKSAGRRFTSRLGRPRW